MKKLLFSLVCAALLVSLVGCASSGSSRSGSRAYYGGSYYRYGYRPWYPCVGCVIPPDVGYPTPEQPIEPPRFEAMPLPSFDMDMDFGTFDDW